MGRKSRHKRERGERAGERPAGAGEIVERINAHLASVHDAYPGAWRELAQMHADEALRAEVGWPDWCWLPLAAAHAVVFNAAPAVNTLASPLASPTSAPVAVLGALGAWRQTKTIYRIDPDLYDALIATDLADRLPPQAFRRLPEWSVYVALPAHAPIPGYFAHLEWDVNQQRPELRLLYDHGDGKLTPGILYLDRATISEALRDVLATTLATAADGQSHDIHTAGDPATEEQWRARALAAGLPVERIDAALLATRELLEVAISTVLYLCVEEPDILDPDQPPERAAHHPADRTGFAAAAATVWEVGYRYGAAVRARHAPSTTAGAAHNPPRAHIRRAHWHHYWTGPRDGERTLALRWIAPTLVGAQDPEQLIPTIKSPPV